MNHGIGITLREEESRRHSRMASPITRLGFPKSPTNDASMAPCLVGDRNSNPAHSNFSNRPDTIIDFANHPSSKPTPVIGNPPFSDYHEHHLLPPFPPPWLVCCVGIVAAMSSYHDDGRPKNDSSALSVAAKSGARKKIRPTYSCLNCHKRKVKVGQPAHPPDSIHSGQERENATISLRQFSPAHCIALAPDRNCD